MSTNRIVTPTITILSSILFSVLIFTAITANSTKYVYSDTNNKMAPEFNLKTLDGKEVTLSSLKGKPSILWFMAAWCPSCVGQADVIKKVKSEFGSKINVFVIDMWSSQAIGGQSSEGLNAETEADMKDFLGKYGSSEWEAAVDTDRVTIRYGILEVDSTVVIDRNGNILLKHLGPSGYQPIKDALSNIAF
jgi:thiol-disulfide isomerase/thioredoxin